MFFTIEILNNTVFIFCPPDCASAGVLIIATLSWVFFPLSWYFFFSPWVQMTRGSEINVFSPGHFGFFCSFLWFPSCCSVSKPTGQPTVLAPLNTCPHSLQMQNSMK